MANPNIVNVATINGKTTASSLSTSLSSVLDNAASSGKVFKINSIVVGNTSSSLTTGVDVGYTDASDTTYYFVKGADVPPNASLVVLDKNNSFYLEEDTTISAKSSSANMDIVISYEDIS